MIRVILISIFAFFLGGCSVGYDKTYCEEHGKDYSDAGVCSGMLKILEDPEGTMSRVYGGSSNCSEGVR